jgi:DNA-binding transcriptional ArsR family regulator
MIVCVTGLTPELAELTARRFAVLGDSNRLRLLDCLHERGEVSVGGLADAIGASHANVSKHLNVLLAERMVGRRRDGQRVLYRITDPSLIRICDEVCSSLRQGVRELQEALG